MHLQQRGSRGKHTGTVTQPIWPRFFSGVSVVRCSGTVEDVGFSGLGVLPETWTQPYSENFPECLLALSHWRDSTVFIIGVPFGTVITRQNSDNRWFVDGVGAVFMGEAPGPLGSVVRKYKLPGADWSFLALRYIYIFSCCFWELVLSWSGQTIQWQHT